MCYSIENIENKEQYLEFWYSAQIFGAKTSKAILNI